MNETNRHPAQWALAVVVTIVATGLVAWAGVTSAGLDRSAEEFGVLGLLLASAVVCAHFPMRFGLASVQVAIDPVPLLAAAVLVPTSDAVLLGVVETLVLLVRHPLPGWQGPFWILNGAATGGVVLGGVSVATHMLPMTIGGGAPVPPHLALVLAMLLEIGFAAFLLVELWATEPDIIRQYVRSNFASWGISITMSAFGLVVLTTYHELWQLVIVLPILLVGMWGAVWVANSQQLEKRRGEHLKDSFSRYVPEGVVNDNLEQVQAIELGGEQVEITVLFCDIRGFTSWSENKGATEVITELNVLLSELSAAVMATGGTLDKFTGDGLMAFWGAPLPAEDHADRACRTALDMLQRLERVNERRRLVGQEPFAVGVGVHSGPAVVGNVGHERRLDYTAIGDTVNTSARLEGATKEIGSVLLISRDTILLLGEEMRDRAMKIGDVSVKGKSKPVEVWALRPLRPELDGVEDTFAA